MKRKILPMPWLLTVMCIVIIPAAAIFISRLAVLQSSSETAAWVSAHIPAMTLEYAAVMIAVLFLYSLTGLLSLSFALPGALLTLVELVSYYKTLINGTPLLLNDITLAPHFFDIFMFALPKITVLSGTVSAIVIFFVFIAVLTAVDLHTDKALRLRLGMCGISLVAAFVLVFTPIFEDFALSLDDSPISEEERVREYGAAVGLYCSYAHSRKDSSADPSVSVDSLIVQVGQLEADAVSADPIGEVHTPTVVFLMSESFFDVTKLPGVEFSEDPLPIFHSLAENYTSGEFISNTYCGGTGYVEMEVLTGICSYLLDGSDTLTSITPDSVYRRIPTIADVFRDNGYRTGFLHSYNSSLYNREAIYTAFAFDEILFEDSFSPDAERRGGYISDMALSEKIIEMYESGDDDMFLFALSMENHQPYTAEKFGGEMQIQLESSIMTETELEFLGAYVNGLYDADRALGRLVEYFSDVDDEVMIVFFGDHLPSLILGEGDTVYSRTGYSSSSVTTDWEPDELAKMLSTDYVIWTNYEDEPLPDRCESSNMLGLSVLERLGMRPGGYYGWLEKYVSPELLIYRPRLYVDADGRVYDSIPEEKAAVMNDYKAVVRDIVYGDGKIFNITRE